MFNYIVNKIVKKYNISNNTFFFLMEMKILAY